MEDIPSPDGQDPPRKGDGRDWAFGLHMPLTPLERKVSLNSVNNVVGLT